MTERPIIFSDEDVRAIIEGRKTTDRQVIEGLGNKWHYTQLLGDWGLSEPPELKDGVLYWRLQTDVDDDRMFEQKCPWEVGDILWVRETWSQHEGAVGGIIFKARCPEKLAATKRWEPPIHMPRAVARLFLEVKDIRVERLQEITEEDAMNEGISSERALEIGAEQFIPTFYDPGGDDVRPDYKEAFSEFWDSIKAKCGYGWDINPWVWIVTFERVGVLT